MEAVGVFSTEVLVITFISAPRFEVPTSLISTETHTIQPVYF